MQQNAAVIELLILCEQKAQRVRAGQHDLHAAGCKYIGKERRALDKVLHERHFIEKYIAEAQVFQHSEISIHISQRVLCRDLNKRRLFQLRITHFREDLTDHGCFARAAQATKDKYPVLRLSVNIVMQLPEALPPAIAAN